MKKLQKGYPYPLGSTFDGSGVNFAIFTENASHVTLCIFDQHGKEQRFTMNERNGNIWHGYLANAKPGLHYGYRLDGVWNPSRGARFNPAKFVIDPYSQGLSSLYHHHDVLESGVIDADQRDNVAHMPKSIVIDEPYDWGNDCRPNIPWSHTIIYETHVRGFTITHPHVPDTIKGTYAGLADPQIIEYLQQLGITTLQLLPVQQHADEPRLQEMGLHNYWGYNVIAPFAIEPRYWSQRPNTTALSEFRDMVKTLHQANIEVILDVVFNHSAELDQYGPQFSLRGIDNPYYYWLDDQGHYLNWSGCGNTINHTQTMVVRMVLDCLRFWVQTCHVDGFRFDLASILGRTPNFSKLAPLFIALQQDPTLIQCKLIAEPWDLGENGYFLGEFPEFFAEWNDHFRNDMRQFWLHQNITIGGFAKRFAASSDYFKLAGRKPWSSINYICAHDGFTLHDLVSFNHKHNQANGENNRDGSNFNASYNHGVEGHSFEPHIQAARLKSMKNLLATLLLSQGTPMLLAGDELGQTQQGNNNSYCQDNPVSWINWSQANKNLTTFVSQLIALRKKIPALMDDQWWESKTQIDHNDVIYHDVLWLNQNAEPLTAQQWQDSNQHVLMIQLSNDWIIAINQSKAPQFVYLPEGQWCVIEPFDPQAMLYQSQHWIIQAQTISVLHHS